MLCKQAPSGKPRVLIEVSEKSISRAGQVWRCIKPIKRERYSDLLEAGCLSKRKSRLYT
jgi:hypothetical protein